MDPETSPGRLDADPGADPLSSRRILSGGIWVLAGTGLSIPLVLLMNVLFARSLGAAGYGSYLLAISVTTVAMTAAGLGVGMIMVREVAAGTARGEAGSARSAVSASTVLVFLAGLIIAAVLVAPPGRWVLRTAFDAGLEDEAPLLAAMLVLASFQVLFGHVFRGFHRMARATLHATLLAPLGAVIVLLVLVVAGRSELTLRQALLIMTAVYAVNVAIAGVGVLYRLRRIDGPSPAPAATARMLLAASWPLLLNGLLVLVLRQIDLWALGATGATREVAFYGAAVRLVAFIGTPLIVVNATMPPVISAMWARGDVATLERRLRVASTLAGLPALLAVVVLFVAGDPILSLLFGEPYGAAALPLAILGIGHFANVLAGSCGITLTMTGNERWGLAASLVSGTFIVATIFPVASRWGMEGAATVISAGLILTNAMTYGFALRRTGMRTHFSPLLTWREVRGVLARRRS